MVRRASARSTSGAWSDDGDAGGVERPARVIVDQRVLEAELAQRVQRGVGSGVHLWYGSPRMMVMAR